MLLLHSVKQALFTMARFIDKTYETITCKTPHLSPGETLDVPVASVKLTTIYRRSPIFTRITTLRVSDKFPVLMTTEHGQVRHLLYLQPKKRSTAVIEIYISCLPLHAYFFTMKISCFFFCFKWRVIAIPF